MNSDTKKILLTGCTGQDGSLMADYLLANTNDFIIGGIRRLSSPNHKNIEHLKSNPRFKLIDLDVTDQHCVDEVIRTEKPDYFINFAANSFVGNSWKMPINHMETNCMAVLYQLEAIRKHAPQCRYYNAGSSEEWGNVDYSPQDEKHPLKPRSPYGASKVAARMLVKVYRESYGLYAIQGFLLNHEGIRRGSEFVTRKISQNVARIKKAIEDKESFEPLKLGNLEATRDWSDSEDFVDGVWRMLNQEVYRADLHSYQITRNVKPSNFWSDKINEYVLSSNETHSIKEFVELAFEAAGIEGVWVGEKLDTYYVLPNYLADFSEFASTKLVEVDPDFYRPNEVETLWGNSDKARKELNWQPKTDFKSLVKKMVEWDIKELNK